MTDKVLLDRDTNAGPDALEGARWMRDALPGIDALGASDGPLLVVVGVFDGLHRGPSVPAPWAAPGGSPWAPGQRS